MERPPLSDPNCRFRSPNGINSFWGIALVPRKDALSQVHITPGQVENYAMAEPTRSKAPVESTNDSRMTTDEWLASIRAHAASLGMKEETYPGDGLILPANGGPPKRIVEKDPRQESDG